MLEDGPLIAPSCSQLPSNLDPEHVYHWFWCLEPHVICEIFTLSSRSVQYEMALYHLQRPRHRRAAAAEGGVLVALMKHFAEALRSFEHIALLYECRMLFINHMMAGLSSVRFLPALERLLPTDPTQYNDSDCLVQCASRCDSVLSSESGGGHCVAEEVDRERWVFRDTDEDVSQRPSHSGVTGSGPGSGGSGGRGGAGRRLPLGADARLAYTVTLFVWAVIRLLLRRLALLREFPPDHPLFDAARAGQLPNVSALGDSYETLFNQKRLVLTAGKRLYGQGKWREAADEFSRAITMPPDDEEGKFVLFVFRSGCQYHLGNYQEAVEDCTTALRYNPTAYAALYQRAEAYEALGRLELALQDLTQLVRLYPDSIPGRQFYVRLAAAHPAISASSGNQAHHQPENRQVLSGGSFPSPPLHQPSPTTSTDSGGKIDLPGFPMDSDSPHLSFTSPELTFHLADLPEYPEPAGVDDPPYLAAFMESAAELEYTFCGRKELGHGAFGRVYKAVHPHGGWFLAVKVVEAHVVEGSDELLRATDLVVSMKHTNTVRCLGLRRLPGFYHICLEYCSAGSLRSLADDLRGLPLPLLRKYAVEVLLGLRYIHSHGLVHRDVKASNVLLRDDGTAKVSDFGTCMRIPDADSGRSEYVKGTVLWMAPEAFRGRYSTLADMWSYGCMLIELSTAKDPWHELRFTEQLTAMVFIATRPDALPTAPPPLSDDLGRHFFHCCVARDPTERVSADLLLRHPWLSSTNAAPAGSLPLPNNASPQDGPPQRSADSDRHPDFPWTICSSVTASSFVQTDGSPLHLVEAGSGGVAVPFQADLRTPTRPSLP